MRNTNYEIILYWSREDDCFVAEVPELSGCMADGTSYIEALENAKLAIDQWIVLAEELGRPIPDAKGRLTYA